MSRIEKLMENYMRHMLGKFDKNNIDTEDNAIYLDCADTAKCMLNKI